MKSSTSKRRRVQSQKNDDTRKTDAVYKVVAKVMADSYLTFVKSQNFHWNVVGNSFVALHLLYEKQYLEIYAAIDVIAERLRALGRRALGRFAEFAQYSSIQESTAELSDQDM